MSVTWNYNTPLLSPGAYNSAMLLARVQGAVPSDSTQDTAEQISVGTIISAATSAAITAAGTTANKAVQATLLPPFSSDAYANNFVTTNAITLVNGHLYWNTTEGKFRVYSTGSSAWSDYDATAQAAAATASAGAAAAAVSGRPYPNIFASQLPQGITSIAIGGTAITGATPGTYPLVFSGGSYTGMSASLVVDTSTTAHIVFGTTAEGKPAYGVNIGGGTTLPTIANPAGATLPGGTTLTPSASTLITAETQTYWVQSSDGTQILLYGNHSGAATAAGAGTGGTFFGGTQLAIYSKTGIDVVAPDRSSARYINGSFVAWAVEGADKRVPLYATQDGYVHAKLAVQVGVANGLTWSWSPTAGQNVLSLGTVPNRLPLGSAGDVVDTTSARFYNGVQIAFGVMDAARRPAIVTTIDGVTSIPRLATARVAAVTASSVFSEKTVSHLNQLFRTTGGISAQITFSGNNLNPVLTADQSKIVYASDRTGAWLYYYQPVAGYAQPGQIDHPVFPLPMIGSCYGDSLTAGQEGYVNVGYYPAVLTTLTGYPWRNWGSGGQKSTQIAMRQGGVAITLSVTSNQIVAGANSVTTINGGAIPAFGALADPDYRFLSNPSTVSYSCTGYLAGVHGTLVRTVSGPTEVYIFTPDAGYSGTTACPANTSFYIDTKNQADSRGVVDPNGTDDEVQIIWAGRNNYNQSAQVQSDIAAMVAFLKPLAKRYVVLGIVNASTEISGSAGYNQIVALNLALAATYGSANFLDIRSVLVAAYNSGNPADVIDHGNDVPPTSLRAQWSYTLAGAIGAADTTFTLTSTNNSSAPAVGFTLLIDSEYIQVTAVSGFTVTNCVRGWAGTAATHALNAPVTGTEALHYNLQGFTAVANAVAARLTANGW